MERYKLVLLLAIFSIFTSGVAAEYVGVAPGVTDLGTLEEGETYEVEFYLVTNIDNIFQVNPNYERPNPQIYREDDSRSYDFKPENSSQEKIDDWIDFPRESFTVDPSTSNAVSLTNGGVANSKGSVWFNLHVPEDAEPGYHAGAINLNPSVSGNSAEGGAAVSTMGLSQFIFVFRVPGIAKRSLKVRDVNALRESDGEARIDYLIENNGTTTIRLNRGNTYLYDKFGNQTGKLTLGGQYIEPGNSKVIKEFWRTDEIESGEYRVRGEMNYLTGKSFIDSTVEIADYIEVEQTDEEEKDTLPWWLILMILVFMSVLLYVLEVDPLAIFLLAGLLAISGYVLVSGLPLYIIGILLTVVVFMLYRWLI